MTIFGERIFKRINPFKSEQDHSLFLLSFFCIPLEHNRDVMEDPARVLLMLCFMSLSTQVIFKDVAKKKHYVILNVINVQIFFMCLIIFYKDLIH